MHCHLDSSESGDLGSDAERGVCSTVLYPNSSICVQIQEKCQSAVLLNAKGEPRGGAGEAPKKNEPKPVSRPAKPAVSYLFFPLWPPFFPAKHIFLFDEEGFLFHHTHFDNSLANTGVLSCEISIISTAISLLKKLLRIVFIVI